MNGLAEVANLGNEISQPEVQTQGENFVDPGVAQPRIQFSGQTLGRTPVAVRQAGEDMVQLLDASMQRARDVSARLDVDSIAIMAMASSYKRRDSLVTFNVHLLAEMKKLKH